MGGVFVCIGGGSTNLPVQLKPQSGDLSEWEFAESLQCALFSGAPWQRREGGLLPKSLLDLAWLSPWHCPDGTLLEAPPLVHDLRFDRTLPRLCAVSLIKGISPRALRSM